MLKIAICDDDPQQIESIDRLLDKYQANRQGHAMQVHGFPCATELLGDLDAGHNYDLFLLDILMPGLSGIELAKELRLRDENIPLIFLTSSTDYALDAFEVHASQYILKPVKEAVFFTVLDKVISSLDKREDKCMLVSTPERKVRIPFHSIVCVESVNRTLRIYLADGTRLDSKTIRVPFATSVAPLKSDARFLHAHNSFVLNMDAVVELTGGSFVMKGGLEVPVPRYKYAGAKTRYLSYLLSHGIDLMGGQ